MARLAISFSRGIRSITGIERFLAVDRVISPNEQWSYSDDVVVLVWGRKKSGVRALDYAQSQKLPVMYLEDGFVRSCSADPHSRTPYSIVADPVGIYYDANRPSSLENMLNSDDETFDRVFGSVEIELTQACLEIMTEYEVVKYNYCKRYSGKLGSVEQPVVLVIDQTYGDASVVYGGMDEQRFKVMLDTAIAENPDAQILLKTHPDVAAGLKQGYLTSYAKTRKIKIISEPYNPISLLKVVDKVYVGTSQMGMEALLLEKDVVVFGKPFYAGWGLTDDRSDIPQRTESRSLLELFFAAYIWYPRYCNPVTGEIWSLPECLEHVLLQKRHFVQNSQKYCCVGITPWKRGYLKSYLRSPDGQVEFSNRLPTRGVGKNATIVTWGYRKLQEDHGSNNPLVRVEDGFLRSSGLGSDYTAPSSLVFDHSGLYFNPRQPSGLEQLLNTQDCQLDEILRAKRLINLILSAGLSKYNLGEEFPVPWEAPSDQKSILVVGQVETDASIHYGCEEISTNSALLERVRKDHPDAYILYKPHPDVVSGNRQGSVAPDVLKRCTDKLIDDIDIVACLELVDELHTMTSLAGFEALLRGKTVVTYGQPFYSGWGLTTDHQKSSTRTRTRTLEELVYFSLIQYPTYMDIATGEFVSPENLINMISARRTKHKKVIWPKRQFTKLYNVCKGLSYAP